ncbi:MAG: NAD-dependent epimerase/dehydratase family protein [Geminicoccaceae bacterium]
MSINVVTGGSGFIGQHLVDQLLAHGKEVRILDMEAPPVLKPGATFIQGSVTDRALVDSVLSDARFVYHTAAIPHLWSPDPALYQEVNVNGTKTVLEAAANAGVERLVHTSSSSVLIDRSIGDDLVILDESHQTLKDRLFGHYAKSKWQAEALVQSFADRLPIVVVMPTLPLGPGDRHGTPPTRMLQDFINGEAPAYVDCLLNVIDVRDVAAGHVLACERGQPSERYILNHHAVDMVTFLRHLEELTGRPMPRLCIPKTAAVLASAVDEAWSTLVSKCVPRAPLAGTRMGIRPVRFSSHLARTKLNLPKTPLLRTLIDAVSWLSEGGQITAPQGKSTLVFSGR